MYNSEFYLGQIFLYAGNEAPKGWVLCQGQLLPIKGNEYLYALLGTMYGGDGVTNFKLPDLRGRAPVHKNTKAEMGGNTPEDKLSIIDQGAVGGQDPITLYTANLPKHTHTVEPKLKFNDVDADENNPADGSFANTNEQLYTPTPPDDSLPFTFHPNTVSATTTNTGSGTPFSNRQPYLGLNFILCVHGQFPVRN